MSKTGWFHPTLEGKRVIEMKKMPKVEEALDDGILRCSISDFISESETPEQRQARLLREVKVARAERLMKETAHVWKTINVEPSLNFHIMLIEHRDFELDK